MRHSTGKMIGGMALLVCGCVAALLLILRFAALGVDAAAARTETKLLNAIIATHRNELSKTVVDYTTWQDMYDNFARHRTAAWEEENLGPSITKQLDIDYVAVVAKSGAIAYFYAKRTKAPVALSAADREALAALARLAFQRPMPARGTPVLGGMTIERIPALVSVSPIFSTRKEPPGFAMMDIRALDAAFVSRMGANFGVNGLHIVGWAGQGLPLQSADGHAPSLALAWNAPSEGHQLYMRMLPAVVTAGMFLLIVFSGLMVLWRRLFEHLRTSEARAMNAELETARTRALAAEETASSKNSFIANMNHELRTPLNAIIGFSDLIQTESYGPIGVPKYLEYVKDISASGKHLLGIIDDILLVSKIDAGKYEVALEPVLLGEALAEAMRIMYVIAMAKRIRIDARACTGCSPVLADRKALRQVLLNLFSNAVKFSPPGSEIRIEEAEGVDGTVLWRIVDRGCGIPPDTLKDIGKPFVQAETVYARNHQETGLGLSICYRLVAAMGGTISVQSTVGTGTTVCVSLKKAQVAEAPASKFA